MKAVIVVVAVVCLAMPSNAFGNLFRLAMNPDSAMDGLRREIEVAGDRLADGIEEAGRRFSTNIQNSREMKSFSELVEGNPFLRAVNEMIQSVVHMILTNMRQRVTNVRGRPEDRDDGSDEGPVTEEPEMPDETSVGSSGTEDEKSTEERVLDKAEEIMKSKGLEMGLRILEEVAGEGVHEDGDENDETKVKEVGTGIAEELANEILMEAEEAILPKGNDLATIMERELMKKALEGKLHEVEEEVEQELNLSPKKTKPKKKEESDAERLEKKILGLVEGGKTEEREEETQDEEPNDDGLQQILRAGENLFAAFGRN